MEQKTGLWGARRSASIEQPYFVGKAPTIDKILKDGHCVPKCELLMVLKHGLVRSIVPRTVPHVFPEGIRLG